MSEELYKQRIEDAIEVIEKYGWIDGVHHKQWCLDQIARILLASRYKEWTEEMLGNFDAELEEYEYEPWDEGIAP